MIVEILTYRLKPGTAGGFAEAMAKESELLHKDAGIDILFHGAISGDPLIYILARQYTNRTTMERQLSEFYGSKPWRDGPRQAIVDAIDTTDQMIVTTAVGEC